jgi:hypothetical protein
MLISQVYQKKQWQWYVLLVTCHTLMDPCPRFTMNRYNSVNQRWLTASIIDGGDCEVSSSPDVPDDFDHFCTSGNYTDTVIIGNGYVLARYVDSIVVPDRLIMNFTDIVDHNGSGSGKDVCVPVSTTMIYNYIREETTGAETGTPHHDA